MMNTVQQSNIFQEFVMNQLKWGSVEKGGSLDDLTDGLNELIHGLKNGFPTQARFNLAIDAKSLIQRTITEGIEGKNTYYSRTVIGRILSAFQSIAKKFLGCVGYRTPIERAQALLNLTAVKYSYDDVEKFAGLDESDDDYLIFDTSDIRHRAPLETRRGFLNSIAVENGYDGWDFDEADEDDEVEHDVGNISFNTAMAAAMAAPLSDFSI